MDTENLDIYGHDPIPWSRVERQLDPGDKHRPYWLATTNPDGTPHLTGVGAIWSEGKIYVVSGPGTRKSRNLAANARCALSAGLIDIDLVVEGTAAKVTDSATLERVAKRYREGGWPVEVRDGAFIAPYSAPSAGPPPWDLYEVTPLSATGVATAAPDGATRWRFTPKA